MSSSPHPLNIRCLRGRASHKSSLRPIPRKIQKAVFIHTLVNISSRRRLTPLRILTSSRHMAFFTVGTSLGHILPTVSPWLLGFFAAQPFSCRLGSWASSQYKPAWLFAPPSLRSRLGLKLRPLGPRTWDFGLYAIKRLPWHIAYCPLQPLFMTLSCHRLWRSAQCHCNFLFAWRPWIRAFYRPWVAHLFPFSDVWLAGQGKSTQ